MKKERTIRIAILSVVFVLAMIIFSGLTNRGNADMTADMSSATLPTISFVMAQREVNTLVGHKREMNLVSVRDTINVYGDDGTLEMMIHYGEGVDSFLYEIYTLDGEKKLYEEAKDEINESVTLRFADVLSENQEGVLKITLYQKNTPIYYYTRIVQDQEYHLQECVDYIQELHNNILTKQNEDAVKKVMESSSEGDNSTLQHVTIHSDLKHIMWGSLKPEIVNQLQMDITEVKAAYTSVLLSYQVVCSGDNNDEEIYNVKEFFKVAYGTERCYLYEYDRTMEEVFNTSNVVLSSKGVILGIADEQMPHKVNNDGTVVAFVQANELWNYNRTEDAFSLIFSFRSSEKYDERNDTDNHSIQILSMEDNGNMTFSVSGYMNRGEHEGESGITIYYYFSETSCVKEIAFIPSNDSYLMMEETLSESAFYNAEKEVLYILSDGTLRKISMQDVESETLTEGLGKGQYVTSEDGQLFAYQKHVDGEVTTEVWDFAKDVTREVTAGDGEIIVPLGFVEDDFVYGISKAEDAGYDATGKIVQAMYRVEIRNDENKIIKSYEQSGVYVLSATVENNMITLTQGTKTGNGYKEIAEDYITNNETSANEYVAFQSYWTDLKETQYRLAFTNTLRDTKAKTLKPKQVIQEVPTVLQYEHAIEEEYYYTFGLGKLAGVFEEAGDAISLADQLSGVVVSAKQSTVWEEDNRVSWYRNFNVSAFVKKDNETTLAACIRKVLAMEGKSVDVVAELSTKTAEQILSEQLGTEAIRFRKCSVKDMFYLVDKGVPVIGLKDGTSAVLIIGYDAKTATYVDPTSGQIHASSIEKIDEMLSGSGNTFIGYLK